MTYRRSLLTAALVAAPLATIGFGAQAADVTGTLENQQQFSTLAQAVKAAGLDDALKGSGPYTIFAPTDQAFSQLPPGAVNYLMQKDHQGELKTLLQYHVVEGKELKPDDVLGKQTKLDTLEGDSLSVDGTGRMVMLVPTGLTVTRMGDRVIVERNVEAMSAPTVEVAPAGQSSQQNGQQQAQTDVTAQGNMPATKHQEQVLRNQPQTEQRQTAGQTEGAMPSSPSQREVLRGQQPGEQSQSGGQQQAGNNAQGQSPNQEQGVLRQATVSTHPIQADNGVIYPIDAVLVPQKILSQLEDQQGQSEQGQSTSPQNQQGQKQGQSEGQTKQKQAEND